MTLGMKYTLYIDDNFHYMDEDERYKFGEFSSLEKAIARAKQIVDAFLVQAYKKGMTAEELYGQYTTFGEDPFIVGGPPPSTFSAWDHARKRCGEICSSDRPF